MMEISAVKTLKNRVKLFPNLMAYECENRVLDFEGRLGWAVILLRIQARSITAFTWKSGVR